MDRGPVDTILALALVHHLAIANNVPLGRIAESLARLCKTLIIEFIPKEDSQVKHMLSSRRDVFGGYTKEGFEREFKKRFSIEQSTKIDNTSRTLYLMKKR